MGHQPVYLGQVGAARACAGRLVAPTDQAVEERSELLCIDVGQCQRPAGGSALDAHPRAKPAEQTGI